MRIDERGERKREKLVCAQVWRKFVRDIDLD